MFATWIHKPIDDTHLVGPEALALDQGVEVVGILASKSVLNMFFGTCSAIPENLDDFSFTIIDAEAATAFVEANLVDIPGVFTRAELRESLALN
jgi:hypothetical protein